MARISAADVKLYYEKNTHSLLAFGQGTEGTIHRAVWGPGVENRTRAMRYVEELISAQVIQSCQVNTPHLADLGCGVGASLCRIAQATGATGLGITLSPKQAALAQTWIAAQKLEGRVTCLEGDFCALPSKLKTADLAYAIEAFVHAPSARKFFRQAANLVKQGGLLVVCDDFATQEDGSARATRWKRRFESGWVLGSLVTAQRADDLAREAGFEQVETVDLGAYLELGRPRDYAIAALMRTFGWLPIGGSYWSMLYGGHALQVCLLRGYVKHLFKVWRRA